MTERRALSGTKRLAIFLERGGICAVCGGKIDDTQKWELDHGRALGLLGEDEAENLFPVHARPCHKIKTKDDVARISKAKRVEIKRYGAKPKRSWSSNWRRKMDGSTVRRHT